ncbi:hypothetical protein CYMTET_32158 [Cymbomonas tetramitiformis]|uniref:Uncharacterized protein n=1 Tax=Cymbomonas tetramitiformis TaxID=36881 RepID=A0AAE0KS84_9CHLO|nr:hypothetical protein CYMTET_32158 [Cymbomonas tetramitiformis]
MKGKHQKVGVLWWTEDANSLWSDHSGESAESLSTPVRLQLVIASRKERESLLRWLTREPRTRHGHTKLYTATMENLQDLRRQGYFKDPQVRRALVTNKMSENDEEGEATVTTAPEELRLIISNRVEGSAQGISLWEKR